ncbi:MAG: hypothetical protein PHW40_07260 [Candidatus Izemoplasmatales bacterium]|nr:hypothetical protein [Candidatus Izemoplasmatales bacterium]
MNVKRIVVDEVPEDGCSECCFSKVFTSKFGNDKVRCVATNKSVSDFAFGYTKQPRPEWCPLEVEEVCEFKAEPPNEFGYVHSKTGCGYTYTDVCHEFIFCPNCGKRIKYESEE